MDQTRSVHEYSCVATESAQQRKAIPPANAAVVSRGLTIHPGRVACRDSPCAFFFACSSGGGFDEDATGFTCSSAGTVTFDSDGCKSRLSSSQCKDGGVEVRGDGGASSLLCCVYEHCYKDPFPELH